MPLSRTRPGMACYVLQFLFFRVIDLGVMVPCDKILKEAIVHNAGALFVLDSVQSLPNPGLVKSANQLTIVFISLVRWL